jgi:peptide/nickel transport system permease protein
VLLAVLAPAIAPYDPIAQQVRDRLKPPSAAHWLGTDGFGRDVLSRTLWGGRVTLLVAVVVVIVGSAFGTLYGAISAYLGGRVDEVLMRMVDVVLAFPSLILAMAIAAALGPSIQNSMLAMLLVWWPSYARLSRAQVLSLLPLDFVLAGRSLGAGPARLLLRHLLPNAVGPIVVLATMDFGNAVITTAALSFLGLGQVPPWPEWGAQVAEGRELVSQWWISTAPAIAIFMVALGFNFLGDGLRDSLDPRIARRRG